MESHSQIPEFQFFAFLQLSLFCESPLSLQKIRACRLLSFQSKSLEAFSFSIRKLIASCCSLIRIHLVVFPYKFLSGNLLKGTLI